MNRREFLKLSAAAAGSVLVSGICSADCPPLHIERAKFGKTIDFTYSYRDGGRFYAASISRTDVLVSAVLPAVPKSIFECLSRWNAEQIRLAGTVENGFGSGVLIQRVRRRSLYLNSVDASRIVGGFNANFHFLKFNFPREWEFDQEEFERFCYGKAAAETCDVGVLFEDRVKWGLADGS